jgi:hypothetical protein
LIVAVTGTCCSSARRLGEKTGFHGSTISRQVASRLLSSPTPTASRSTTWSSNARSGTTKQKCVSPCRLTLPACMRTLNFVRQFE